MMTVKIIQDINAFLKEIKKIESISNPFINYFSYQSLSQFYMPRKFISLAIYDNEKVIGLLPLVRKQRVYYVYGQRFFNYLGYIANEKDVAVVHNEVISFLRLQKRIRVLIFYDVYSDWDFEKTATFQDGDVRFVKLYDCPLVEFPKSFSEYLSGLSKKTRYNIKRETNKFLSLSDNINLIALEGPKDKDALIRIFPEMVALHKKRFENTYIPKNLNFHENIIFFLDYLVKALENDKGYISILSFEGKIISFIIGLKNNKRVIDWIPAFNPAFAKYSVGNVHLYMTFQDLCNKGYNAFDFSKGSSVYKDKWATSIKENRAYFYSFSPNLFSSILFYTTYHLYSLKSKLRSRGTLTKIKTMIASIVGVRNNRIEHKKNVQIILSSQKETETFSFAHLFQYPEYIQIQLLDLAYHGNKIVSVREANEIYITILEEKNES